MTSEATLTTFEALSNEMRAVSVRIANGDATEEDFGKLAELGARRKELSVQLATDRIVAAKSALIRAIEEALKTHELEKLVGAPVTKVLYEVSGNPAHAVTTLVINGRTESKSTRQRAPRKDLKGTFESGATIEERARLAKLTIDHAGDEKKLANEVNKLRREVFARVNGSK